MGTDVKTHRGIYYFPTWLAATLYAQSINAPTDRILSFQRGWAIQWHRMGPYVGPENLTHEHCRWACTV